MDYIIQPLICAFIGCFTNYIAIKMLFRPYNPKKIFGKNIPFTPGIIPKRRDDIAKSIGNIVSRDLIDRNEILAHLSSDNIVDNIVDFIMNIEAHIPDKIQNDKSFGDFIAEFISSFDIKEAVSYELYNYINQKISGNIAFKFIGDKMIYGIAETIGEMIQNYISGDGKNFISRTIDNEIYKLSGMKIEEILFKYEFDVLEIRQFLGEKYKNLLYENIDIIFENIDISNIVEKKIMSMDMRELERLILAVMKKELNAVVYLGAGIGFIIGFFNL